MQAATTRRAHKVFHSSKQTLIQDGAVLLSAPPSALALRQPGFCDLALRLLEPPATRLLDGVHREGRHFVEAINSALLSAFGVGHRSNLEVGTVCTCVCVSRLFNLLVGTIRQIAVFLQACLHCHVRVRIFTV